MLDVAALRQLIEGQPYRPLFMTVSGAHLYGFPSPDSDIDLRGAHLLPLRDVVSHDLAKYQRLLTRNNVYVLEQVFSPLVVTGQDFLERLRPMARRCITRHH